MAHLQQDNPTVADETQLEGVHDEAGAEQDEAQEAEEAVSASDTSPRSEVEPDEIDEIISDLERSIQGLGGNGAVADNDPGLTAALDALGIEGDTPDARVRAIQSQRLEGTGQSPDGLAGRRTLNDLVGRLEGLRDTTLATRDTEVSPVTNASEATAIEASATPGSEAVRGRLETAERLLESLNGHLEDYQQGDYASSDLVMSVGSALYNLDMPPQAGDPNFQDAIADYQRSRGLESIDGQAGPETLRSLVADIQGLQSDLNTELDTVVAQDGTQSPVADSDPVAPLPGEERVAVRDTETVSEALSVTQDLVESLSGHLEGYQPGDYQSSEVVVGAAAALEALGERLENGDPNFEGAIADYQRSRGLESIDGYAGPETLASLVGDLQGLEENLSAELEAALLRDGSEVQVAEEVTVDPAQQEGLAGQIDSLQAEVERATELERLIREGSQIEGVELAEGSPNLERSAFVEALGVLGHEVDLDSPGDFTAKLTAFQESHGLEATGVADQETFGRVSMELAQHVGLVQRQITAVRDEIAFLEAGGTFEGAETQQAGQPSYTGTESGTASFSPSSSRQTVVAASVPPADGEIDIIQNAGIVEEDLTRQVGQPSYIGTEPETALISPTSPPQTEVPSTEAEAAQDGGLTSETNPHLRQAEEDLAIYNSRVEVLGTIAAGLGDLSEQAADGTLSSDNLYVAAALAAVEISGETAEGRVEAFQTARLLEPTGSMNTETLEALSAGVQQALSVSQGQADSIGAYVETVRDLEAQRAFGMTEKPAGADELLGLSGSELLPPGSGGSGFSGLSLPATDAYASLPEAELSQTSGPPTQSEIASAESRFGFSVESPALIASASSIYGDISSVLMGQETIRNQESGGQEEALTFVREAMSGIDPFLTHGMGTNPTFITGSEVRAYQGALGVEETGTVDASTMRAIVDSLIENPQAVQALSPINQTAFQLFRPDLPAGEAWVQEALASEVSLYVSEIESVRLGGETVHENEASNMWADGQPRALDFARDAMGVIMSTHGFEDYSQEDVLSDLTGATPNVMPADAITSFQLLDSGMEGYSNLRATGKIDGATMSHILQRLIADDAQLGTQLSPMHRLVLQGLTQTDLNLERGVAPTSEEVPAEEDGPQLVSRLDLAQ